MGNNFEFGQRSEERIATVHWNLELVLRQALSLTPFDITVTCGRRGREDQERAFADGNSKTQWPDSKHNVADDQGNEIAGRSDAVDIAPWINGTINWDDSGSFYVLGGIMLASAELMNVKIRFGGDWDGDGLTEDQGFKDLCHYEIVG